MDSNHDNLVPVHSQINKKSSPREEIIDEFTLHITNSNHSSRYVSNHNVCDANDTTLNNTNSRFICKHSDQQLKINNHDILNMEIIFDNASGSENITNNSPRHSRIHSSPEIIRPIKNSFALTDSASNNPVEIIDMDIDDTCNTSKLLTYNILYDGTDTKHLVAANNGDENSNEMDSNEPCFIPQLKIQSEEKDQITLFENRSYKVPNVVTIHNKDNIGKDDTSLNICQKTSNFNKTKQSLDYMVESDESENEDLSNLADSLVVVARQATNDPSKIIHEVFLMSPTTGCLSAEPLDLPTDVIERIKNSLMLHQS